MFLSSLSYTDIGELLLQFGMAALFSYSIMCYVDSKVAIQVKPIEDELKAMNRELLGVSRIQMQHIDQDDSSMIPPVEK